MTTSRLTRLTELRRALPLAAAGLFLLALTVPVWRITLTAPQYVDALVIELYAHPKLGGDWEEVRRLNKYVGFYYPDPVYVEPNFDVQEGAIAVPEWSFGPLPFLIVAATGVFVALAPTVRKLKLGLKGQLAGTVVTFTALFAIIQYRLYQAGHSLDPHAPMTGVDAFTPPVFGPYHVANISGFASFGPGGYLTLAAVVLMFVAYLFRDSEATISDLPAILRGLPDLARERIRRRRDPGTTADGDPS